MAQYLTAIACVIFAALFIAYGVTTIRKGAVYMGSGTSGVRRLLRTHNPVQFWGGVFVTFFAAVVFLVLAAACVF